MGGHSKLGVRTDSFLERHANAIGINRAEFFGPPRLSLQLPVGVHVATTLLVFVVHGLDSLYGESHHRLIPDLPCKGLVGHASYVEVGIVAADTDIIWRSAVSERFFEAASPYPPI